MSRISHLSMLALCVVALMLVGCSRSSTPASGAAQKMPHMARAPVMTDAGPASVGDVHVDTRRYRIDIRYPRLPPAEAVLMKALHQQAAKVRHAFMQALPDPKQYPGLANRQLQLQLDFSVAARMPAFVSVREKGMADTGGAHPMPLDASFVFATRTGQLVTLDDLFTDPAKARQRFSDVACKALVAKLLAKVPGGARTPAKARAEWQSNMRQMITEGTAPTAQNISEFVVLAGAGDAASGIELIFPPYQVAPYVYGSQSVDVPVEAFADLLKPAWRGDFDTSK
ncbi:MAG TPA: RsiV family protein [Rhodanobacteraceae bacterium]